MSRLAACAILAAASALAARPGSASPGATGVVEREFAATVRRVVPATVVCHAKGTDRDRAGSSGVLITKDGYVLSDGDAGLWLSADGLTRRHVEEVEVRVPDPKTGTTRGYDAKVVRRDAALDTSLLRIEDPPPPGGFPFVPLGTADDLRVGAITFALGSSFGHGDEGTPTLTAGVVSGLVRASEAGRHGRFLELYSSAATNPGVNGGPLVDVEGRLVGVVSTWIQPDARDPASLTSPYQFLTKAFPIDRLRAYYRGLPASVLPEPGVVFPDPKDGPPRARQAAQLELALAQAAAEAAPKVVSLTVERSEPVAMELESGSSRPDGDKKVVMTRYRGPVSGVLLSDDGWVVTSLYNLANTVSLAMRSEPRIERDLKNIVSITVHRGEESYPARLVADDHRLGIALVKAETGAPAGTLLWEPAPKEAFQVGRMVLCVGNPFGARSPSEPLLTFGIVSRVHGDDAEGPWGGNVQTDAGGTDANCGGALVDLRGRLLGLATMWNPFVHGRNSGVSFGVPWERIAAVLPRLREGRSVRPPLLGVEFDRSGAAARVGSVVAGGAAEKAGLKAGDTIVAIDGTPVATAGDAIRLIRERAAGDRVRVRVERDGKPVELTATLGDRSTAGP